MKNLKINVPDGYEIDKDKSTFENIVFKKKAEFPKSFFDLGGIDGFYITEMSYVAYNKPNKFWNQSDRNVFKTKEQAAAAVALAQLSQLRDVYRQGWKPDWNNSTEYKWIICFKGNKIHICREWLNTEFLSFEDEETADLFLENFRDLIEQAKPLMS